MIINIRGGSGSGKTTVMRKFLARYEHLPVRGCLGSKYPEAYWVAGFDRPVYVLGPYTGVVLRGGCDAISSMEQVTRLIAKYNAKGDVIFEGLLISSMYGSVATFLENYKKHALVAFLTTPEERCRTNLGLRWAEKGKKGDKTFLRHHEGTQRVRARMLKDNIVRVEDLDPDRAVEQITKWLTH